MKHELSRILLQRVWEARLRSQGVTFDSGLRLFGRPIVSAVLGSVISIGKDCTLVSKSQSQVIGVSHPTVIRTLFESASILIGDNFGMSGGSLVAAESIQIGDGCLLGADVTIVDTDFHPIDSRTRFLERIPTPRPQDRVIVEDNVFIGTRSVVLKGSHIGMNSVIGAGSVVAGKIPANVIAAGVPARPLRAIEPHDY